MKNSKKILCLVLCLATVLTMVFTFAACNGDLTEKEKEKLRTELISDSTADLTRAETTLEMTNATSGIKSQISVTWDMSSQAKSTPVLNADIIFLQYNVSDDTIPTLVNVAFIRGDLVYGKQVKLEISDGDKLAVVKNKMSELAVDLEKTTVEDLLDKISAETEADLSALGNLDLSFDNADAGAEQLAPILQMIFGTLTVKNDGYVVAFDSEKFVDRLWETVYSVAEKIDEVSNVTLSTLYKNETIKTFVQKLPFTAKEMETAINQAIAEANKKLPTEQKLNLTALVAGQDETLYDYLGRYLTLKIDGTDTLGSLTLGEAICLLFKLDKMLDLTDALDSYEKKVVPDLKKKLEKITCELKFTKDKKFDGFTFGIEDAMMTLNVKPLKSVSLAVTE